MAVDNRDIALAIFLDIEEAFDRTSFETMNAILDTISRGVQKHTEQRSIRYF